MKTFLYILVLALLAQPLLGQSHGISYQAIIIDSEELELPGVDLEGAYMPEQPLTLRFSILDENGGLVYQEEQYTETDRFGMINLTIGDGELSAASPVVFTEIDWDGSPMNLLVEISIGETAGEFTEFSEQALLFVPYAFHRNITATGTLSVDGETSFNSALYVLNGSPTFLTGDLTVDGSSIFQDITVLRTSTLNGAVDVTNSSPVHLTGTLVVDEETNLNDALNVNNASEVYFTGPLDVDGPVDLNSNLVVHNESQVYFSGTLGVEGITSLNEELRVTSGSPANLSGMLTVEGPTELNNTLEVNAASAMNGQVTISADVNGNDASYGAYPLRVEGSNQGIAIRIDGTRNTDNNFVTFWDAAGIQGRIEGQTDTDLLNEPQYIFDQSLYAAQTAVQVVNLATAAAAAIADPGNLIIETANSAALAAEITAYNIFAFSNLGVTYESGSGDYAEWLPRLNPEEEMSFGQIVGVKGGMITRSVEGAEQLMVISRAPIVLGNMPPDSLAAGSYEKVAFMGQVPVWIIGKVNTGDYILPYDNTSGYGRAVSPAELTPGQLGLVVGRSWGQSSLGGPKLVNVVVGVNSREWAAFIEKDREEITALQQEVAQLRERVERSEEVLAELVPGYSEAMGKEPAVAPAVKTEQTALAQNTTAMSLIVQPTRESIIDNFEKTAKLLVQSGYSIDDFPFYKRFQTDAAYREMVIELVLKHYANTGE